MKTKKETILLVAKGVSLRKFQLEKVNKLKDEKGISFSEAIRLIIDYYFKQ